MIPPDSDSRSDPDAGSAAAPPPVYFTTEHQRRCYIDVLAPHCPDESPEKLVALGGIITACRRFKYPHVMDETASVFTERKLRAVLGRNHAEQFGHILERGKKSRFGTGAYTRPLKVRADVDAELRDKLREPRPPSKLVHSDDTPILKARTERRHSVARSRQYGSGLPGIPREVQVDELGLERAETVMSDWLSAAYSDAVPELAPEMYAVQLEQHRKRHTDKDADEAGHIWRGRVERRLEDAQNILELTRAYGANGRFPQRYEQRNGMPRFIGMGPNLQSCPREIRDAALAGQWSTDIKCCHHTALLGHERPNKPCPIVREYVADREALRIEFAKAAGTDEETMKTVLLALVYGGRFRWSLNPVEGREWAIRELLGLEAQERLYQYARFRRFSRELKHLFENLIADHKPARGHRGRGVKNAVGQYMNPETDRHRGKAVKRMRFVAFLLQGIECEAMQAMVSVTPTAQVSLHDGITSLEPARDEELRTALFDATDIPFAVEQKIILAPDWR